jgi:hypothetical protein
MHLTHDDLVLHYYGESGPAAWRLDAHLASCAACRDAMGRLQRTLALVDANGEGEPAAGYEATLWARIQDRLDPPRPWWRQVVRLDGGRWALAAGTAAIAGVAFSAGWQAREIAAPVPAATSTDASQGAAPGDAPPGSASAAGASRARVLEAALRDHLTRAETVLSEVANGEAGGGTAFTAERLRASDLVATNRLVRQTAAYTGDEPLGRLLDELERTLVDIANAPDELTPDEWRALRARLDTQGLLFRVRVLADDLCAGRPDTTSPLKKGKTS